MGFFSKLKEGLKKTKDNIGKKFFSAFSGRALDDEFYDSLEEAMLTADMGVTATEQILDEFKDEVYKNKITDPEKAKDLLKRIMVDSISYEIPDYDYPLVILLAGVNGVGKTTAVGKLANHFRSMGKSVVVAAADTFRAAAIDQLKVWADRAGATMIRQEMGSDPASVAFDTLTSAKANGADVVLIDTAGRLHNKVNLMNELTKIRNVMGKVIPGAPHEVMLVLDGSTGQNAFEQARQFTQATQVTSLTITKLDGTAKGGVVIGISDQFRIPVRYIGIGEGIDQLRIFDRKEFVNALFGHEKN